jgi:hypothetical protein
LYLLSANGAASLSLGQRPRVLIGWLTSANGAFHCQPGAAPQDLDRIVVSALKARLIPARSGERLAANRHWLSLISSSENSPAF